LSVCLRVWVNKIDGVVDFQMVLNEAEMSFPIHAQKNSKRVKAELARHVEQNESIKNNF